MKSTFKVSKGNGMLTIKINDAAISFHINESDKFEIEHGEKHDIEFSTDTDSSLQVEKV